MAEFRVTLLCLLFLLASRFDFSRCGEEEVALGAVHRRQSAENSDLMEALARFAVNEHNKKQNSALQFVKLLDSREQVVSGMMYYLTLEAKDGTTTNTYQAKVWQKAWLDFQELQEFKQVTGVSTIHW